MGRFDDKVVWITGAASGIGRATAERIASEGGHLICADVQAAEVEATAKRAIELGGSAIANVCDVSQEDSVAASLASGLERYGRLDAVCHIAGILRFAHTHEMDFETWRKVQAVNADGTFLVCRAALPHLLETGGNIVNMSSAAAVSGLIYGAAYAASKGAVWSFTKALAIEYAARGVRINAVCPGGIKTPMTKGGAGLPEDADMKLVMRQTPLDHGRGPETVAALIAFLASDEAAHINGEDIVIDGGATA
ncbi:MAG: SDR family NAD(P)-dependent oxidoreductase [Myxococcota bacterium]